MHKKHVRHRASFLFFNPHRSLIAALNHSLYPPLHLDPSFIPLLLFLLLLRRRKEQTPRPLAAQTTSVIDDFTNPEHPSAAGCVCVCVRVHVCVLLNTRMLKRHSPAASRWPCDLYDLYDLVPCLPLPFFGPRCLISGGMLQF